MQFNQVSAVLVIMMLMGCDTTTDSGEQALSQKPVNGSERPRDDLANRDASSISSRQPNLEIHTPQDSEMKPTPHPFGGAALKPLSPPEDAIEAIAGDIDELRNLALNAQAPKTRIKALRAMVPLVGNNAEVVLPTFEKAISDNDQAVREEALKLVYRKSLPVPSNIIYDAAITDPVDNVRGRAWIALVERNEPDLRGYLMDALLDPNPNIRRDAGVELDKLDAREPQS